MKNEEVTVWIYRIGLVNIAIILYLRVGLVYEELSPIYYETHGNKEVARQMKAEVGDTPLVFINSYRDAPMFGFYTGNRTFSLNDAYYRRNQFSIDDSESKIQKQRVLFFNRQPKTAEVTFTKSNGGQYFGEYIDDFESFRKLKTIVEGPIPLDTEKEQTLKIYNPYNNPIALNKLRFNVAYMNDFKKVKNAILVQPKPVGKKTLSLVANDTTYFTFTLPEPKMKNPTYFRVGISENGLPFGINGQNTELLY